MKQIIKKIINVFKNTEEERCQIDEVRISASETGMEKSS